jgi:aminoglycoside phosphotransferase (APT) family kinase protein
MTGTALLPPGWVIQEALAVTPVSRTWRVVADGRQAVLRVDEPLARRLGLDRAAEPGVLRTVADAGLGPACLDADATGGWLLTEWLPGSAWSAPDLREPANLRRAAGLLRRLHGLPPAGPVLDLAAAIDRYAALGGTLAAGPARVAREQLARCRSADAAADVGAAADPPCLCHNDPTPGNFIAVADGSLRLIDWEYAGLGHPAFDLAGLAVGADLDPSGDEILLRAYRGRSPQPGELARHEAWKAFCRTLGALWTGALIQ